MLKKIFIVTVFSLLLIGGGCAEHKDAPASDEEPWRDRADQVNIQNKILAKSVIKNLEQNKIIKEIKLPVGVKVPVDVYPKQFQKFFKLDTLTFALVQGSGWNTYFMDSTTPYSGIWYIDKQDREWKPFFEIKKGYKEYGVQNNPFYFWNEGSRLYLLISDTNGAGSGEGTAKVLTSDTGGAYWHMERCFYFVPDHFFEQERRLGINFLSWFKKNLAVDYDKGGIVMQGGEHVFNVTTNNFELTQFNKETRKTEVIPVEECKNIILP